MDSLISEMMMIPKSITTMVIGSHVLSTNPSANAAAGGCSVSVITMKKMASPVAIAPNTMREVSTGTDCMEINSGISDMKPPTAVPMIYPPIR